MDSQTVEGSPSDIHGEDIVVLDKTFADVKTSRKALVAKMSALVDTMDINFGEARTAEVQLQAVNTLRQTLSDMEAAEVRRLGIKLKKKDTETASKHSAAVVQLLGQMRNGMVSSADRPVLDTNEAQSRLERAFEDNHLAPITDAELKKDPYDFDG